MIVSGTGHRPNKLGGYSRQAHEKLAKVAHEALCELKPETVISGGALGWDQALADAAIHMGLQVTMALPFEGFETKWPKESQEFLHSLMNSATVMYVCDPGYAPWKMQKRNEWMVDNCDTVLALWNGSNGGTGNCVRYATQVGKPIVNLWSKYNAIRT